jgi:exodeoxyribonuclease V alpha subunit
LANGDIGLIWLDVESGLKAVFQQADGILAVPIGHLPGHEPAYAMTVHKAQGSEYGHVELILPESDNPLLSKALVYTALTRCRRSLQLNADAAILGAALGRTLPRINGLSAIARSLMEQEIQ